ncbi:MAG TPA: TetR/AcrR family transcriptional regulator [Nocardioidaceae bacterium]|nr:TetR/AcrR family transcriptional regulator [Nocardioidaceae bacterium]
MRLSRAESQAKTRELLIQTARRLFVSDGFLGTSLEKVAAEAGYSKGAVYSNFSSKFELGFAVIDWIHTEQVGRLRQEIAEGTTVDELIDGFSRWADASVGNEEWTMLELELVVGSRGNPALRTEVAKRRAEIAARFAEILEEQRQKLGMEFPISVAEATALAWTMGVGVGIQRAVDPELSIRPLVDLLRTIAVVAATTSGAGQSAER